MTRSSLLHAKAVLATAAILTTLLLVGCGAPTVRYSARVPAEVDVGDIERIAIAEFDGVHQTGRMVALKLTEGIVANGRFRVFERTKLDEILAEAEFWRSEHVDPATAHQLMLAGVDGLIFGVVDVYSVDDQTGVTRIETEVGTGEWETVLEKDGRGKTREVRREVMKKVMIDRGHVLREGTMGVTFRLADVISGQIVAIKTNTVHFSQKAWEDERETLPAKDMILESLSAQVADRFLAQIQPRTVVRAARFEENEVAETEVGIKYAKAGLWDQAAMTLRTVAVAAPSLASAHYNVGIALDALGRHGAAELSLERAIGLDPKDEYIRLLAQVRDHGRLAADLRQQETGR